jgi:hypothetical protein
MNAEETQWIKCPQCGKQTRVKIKETTIMTDFLLFCTWCKTETVINVEKFKVEIVKKDK